MNTQTVTTVTTVAPSVVPLSGTELETHLARELAQIELDVTTSYTLADAIREGSSVTGHKTGGFVSARADGGEDRCALAAGHLAARARGYLV